MTRKVGRIIAVAALASLAATRLSAADFTFNVPVKISNLNANADEVRIQCTVSKSTDFSSGPDQVAWGQKSLGKPVSGYSGTVVVPIDALPGKDPADGNHYKCRILVVKTNVTNEPSFNASEAWHKAKSGTPLKASVTGSVP